MTRNVLGRIVVHGMDHQFLGIHFHRDRSRCQRDGIRKQHDAGVFLQVGAIANQGGVDRKSRVQDEICHMEATPQDSANQPEEIPGNSQTDDWDTGCRSLRVEPGHSPSDQQAQANVKEIQAGREQQPDKQQAKRLDRQDKVVAGFHNIACRLGTLPNDVIDTLPMLRPGCTAETHALTDQLRQG